ncbi:hypothetical protein TNIN_31421 [Trichonephila inaurata madagascariensis]|uniref:Uncharacterized protein n=1 Tax=Trichonephila inaurata madagascariensis TaxID=2747483 RepID=A0A8X6Y9E2_9ARAC|nr:hypothetical protein TNIN_31421 [Trichonephila inaurata madagascariensis]
MKCTGSPKCFLQRFVKLSSFEGNAHFISCLQLNTPAAFLPPCKLKTAAIEEKVKEGRACKENKGWEKKIFGIKTGVVYGSSYLVKPQFEERCREASKKEGF